MTLIVLLNGHIVVVTLEHPTLNGKSVIGGMIASLGGVLEYFTLKVKGK